VAKKKSEDTAGAALFGGALIIGLILIALSDQSWGPCEWFVGTGEGSSQSYSQQWFSICLSGVRSFSFILCGLNSGGREWEFHLSVFRSSSG